MGLTDLREKTIYTDKTKLNPAARDDTYTVQFLAQTDCFVSLDINVSSRAAGFNLVLSVYVFFSLKAVEPIDCHYMTDRQQRFWVSYPFKLHFNW